MSRFCYVSKNPVNHSSERSNWASVVKIRSTRKFLQTFSAKLLLISDGTSMIQRLRWRPKDVSETPQRTKLFKISDPLFPPMCKQYSYVMKLNENYRLAERICSMRVGLIEFNSFNSSQNAQTISIRLSQWYLCNKPTIRVTCLFPTQIQ